MLPAPRVDVKAGALVEDTRVRVVAAVNASKTQRELADLRAGRRDESTSIEDPLPAPKTRPDEYKYTVTDERGRSAYLISCGLYRVGARIVIKQGTEIWRSVLIPQSDQIVAFE